MCNIPLHELKKRDFKGFFHTVILIWTAKLAGKYQFNFQCAREEIDDLYKQIFDDCEQGKGGE